MIPEIPPAAAAPRAPGENAPPPAGPRERVAVCLPVFDDWESALAVLKRLDEAAPAWNAEVSVTFVDDGSPEAPPHVLPFAPRALAAVEVLQLHRNLGHQRAIAIGLADLLARRDPDYLVVLDADGEDRPEDVAALLQRCRETGGTAAVFARRRRRTEGLGFRLGYLGFKLLHRLLTGRKVEVGNFSVVPRAVLARLAGVSEIWNHYAAAVVHARLPRELVPLARGRRLAGRSRMDLAALVRHGLSAISVFGDTAGVRLLLLVACFLAAAAAGLVLLLAGAAGPLPAGAPALALIVGSAAVLLFNLLLQAMLFCLLVLQRRDLPGFLPLRDYALFIAGRRTLHG